MSSLSDPIEQILEAGKQGGELLVCRCCHNPITTDGEKIEIGLSHHYRFTNPAGISYSIGCFRHAPGCTLVGEATAEDSWFGGYSWQVAICAECLEHIGWYYQNPLQRFFFGLIPERLRNAQSDDGN